VAIKTNTNETRIKRWSFLLFQQLTLLLWRGNPDRNSELRVNYSSGQLCVCTAAHLKLSFPHLRVVLPAEDGSFVFCIADAGTVADWAEICTVSITNFMLFHKRRSAWMFRPQCWWLNYFPMMDKLFKTPNQDSMEMFDPFNWRKYEPKTFQALFNLLTYIRFYISGLQQCQKMSCDGGNLGQIMQYNEEWIMMLFQTDESLRSRDGQRISSLSTNVWENPWSV